MIDRTPKTNLINYYIIVSRKDGTDTVFLHDDLKLAKRCYNELVKASMNETSDVKDVYFVEGVMHASSKRERYLLSNFCNKKDD